MACRLGAPPGGYRIIDEEPAPELSRPFVRVRTFGQETCSSGILSWGGFGFETATWLGCVCENSASFGLCSELYVCEYGDSFSHTPNPVGVA